MWRVFDNLLSNACKYSAPASRLYIDAVKGNGTVQVILKNISRDELNVPAEDLVERFVRGDASRTDGGSGLGLSIAKSLTELTGGSFIITIDGDLFKTTVSMPACE